MENKDNLKINNKRGGIIFLALLGGLFAIASFGFSFLVEGILPLLFSLLSMFFVILTINLIFCLKIIKAKCSNCGKLNKYSKEEWKGREQTKCKKCYHTLTVCGGYVEEIENEN